jgi:multidrug efflux pump subunit AcrA (membrane-fusion protein)
VEPGEIVVEVMGTGTLDAHVKAAISTKIPGRLKKVLVDQGDTVKEGQEVARLDEHDLGHEVEVEEANVGAKKAAVERLQAEITQTKVVLTQATSNEARVRRQIASGVGSQDELDKAIESLGVARANLARTEAALVEGKRQIVTAAEGSQAMNLAIRDIRSSLGRFVFTALGIGMLLMIVMGMGGIYRGIVEDATLLVDSIVADLWVVSETSKGVPA